MNPLPLAPAPDPVDVGLVIALPMEIGPFLDLLGKVRRFKAQRFTVIEGELHGKVVAVVLSGMGRVRAQRAAEHLIAGHRPLFLISAGYAGALNPELKRNQIVLAREVVNIEGNRFPVDPPLAWSNRAHSGTLLTTDAIARTAAEKADLRSRFGADVVDMETSAITAYAAERGVRFASVRVVSDEAGINLPREILTITGETGGVRLGATLGALWKRPAVLGELLTLREHATAAAESLATFLAESVRSLSV